MKITRAQVESIKPRELSDATFSRYVVRYRDAVTEVKQGLAVLSSIETLVQGNELNSYVSIDYDRFRDVTIGRVGSDMRRMTGVDASTLSFFRDDGAEIITHPSGRKIKKPVLELQDLDVFRTYLQRQYNEHNRLLDIYLKGLEITKSGVKVSCYCYDSYSEQPNTHRVASTLGKLLTYIYQEDVAVNYDRGTERYMVRRMSHREEEALENLITPQKNNKLVVKF